MSPIHQLVGLIVSLQQAPRVRDERGLSQSTENAILLAGAAAIALVVITAITAYVTDRLPS
ncbi:MAG TPA: hypothetical protein PLE12_05790 [Propionicimonas sp.]|jgi:pantothenate synthetase|nr:hypothetical protein [Propionicimonas sp.]